MKFPLSLTLILLLGSTAAFADCAITLPSGSSASAINSALQSALQYKKKSVCLSIGTYSLGSTQINIPQGKTLEGLGASRTDVVLASTANRAILLGHAATLKNFTLSGPGGSASAEYGVVAYNVSDATIWGLSISGFYINIGINGSLRTRVLDTIALNNGVVSNSIPEPNIWISESPYTEIHYGAVYGQGNKPFGDGEISCYSSPNLHINGVYSFDSGTSAFYLVDCDNAVIENAVVYRAGGFGLDIVGGTDNFLSLNNNVQDSWYAGSVYDNSVNYSGNYQNTIFTGNNRSGDSRFCSGIYLISPSSGNHPSTGGSSATPSPLICP